MIDVGFAEPCLLGVFPSALSPAPLTCLSSMAFFFCLQPGHYEVGLECPECEPGEPDILGCLCTVSSLCWVDVRLFLRSARTPFVGSFPQRAHFALALLLPLSMVSSSGKAQSVASQ